jgi:hypothetical protein
MLSQINDQSLSFSPLTLLKNYDSFDSNFHLHNTSSQICLSFIFNKSEYFLIVHMHLYLLNLHYSLFSSLHLMFLFPHYLILINSYQLIGSFFIFTCSCKLRMKCWLNLLNDLLYSATELIFNLFKLSEAIKVCVYL